MTDIAIDLLAIAGILLASLNNVRSERRSCAMWGAAAMSRGSDPALRDAVPSAPVDELEHDALHPLDPFAPDVGALRRRLFAVLGWTAVGLGALAGFGLLFAFAYDALLTHDPGVEPGLLWVGASTAAGFGLFLLVAWVASLLSFDSRRSAQVLLWLTCLAYALLMNVFTAALIPSGYLQETATGAGMPTVTPPHLDFFTSMFLPILGGVGGSVLAVLGVAIGIGYGGSELQTPLRWLAFVVLIAGAFAWLWPDWWWVGIIAALLLAWGVDIVVGIAIRRPDIPEAALAACLVAATAAVVIWIVYLLVRLALQIAAAAAEGAAAGSR